MNTKLTLTIDRNVIERAKEYASQRGRSLSDMVENYFKVVSSEESPQDTEIQPITKSLKGSFKAPAGFNYKEALKKGLSEKYL